METADKFAQYERYLCMLCNTIGFNVLDNAWKKTYRTYTSMFLCSQYFFWMVWSLIIASDTFELLKSLSFLGFFFQCSLKMYYTIANASLYGITFDGLKQAIYVGHTNGTPEQKSNDRLYGYIWNLPWYMLPSEEQLRFKFMLGRSQIPAEMVIRSVGPLNMETFTDIMQKIYSAFTMMYSFLLSATKTRIEEDLSPPKHSIRRAKH
uniref:Odorant receptor n=1 Tax=Anopheles culicifacies TaxID=139723 RepID=A0A182LRQ3_9DIPT